MVGRRRPWQVVVSQSRIALKLEYDGTKFSGSQMQSKTRTVQEDIEKALASYFRTEGRRIVAVFSGRTDAGVHARSQIAHFDLLLSDLDRAINKHIDAANLAASNLVIDSSATLKSTSSSDRLPARLDEQTLRTLCWSLNGLLARDIAVVDAQVVPDQFHARFSAHRRTYVYRILNRTQRAALGHNAQYFVHSQLNLGHMQAAANCLVGRHDFRAFKSSNSDEGSTLCAVERAELLNLGEGELEFWISANHFVYNMVRIIVGTLVDIGLGKREPSALSHALTGKDRRLAGPTAPPSGLCLHSIDYPDEFNLFQRGSISEPAKSQEI